MILMADTGGPSMSLEAKAKQAAWAFKGISEDEVEVKLRVARVLEYLGIGPEISILGIHTVDVNREIEKRTSDFTPEKWHHIRRVMEGKA